MTSASPASPDFPIRGEIWKVNLDPVIGHEQGGERPAVIVSANGLNRSRARVVIVAPMTTVYKGVPWHIKVERTDGDVRRPSYIKCEDIRSVSTDRLIERWGSVSDQTMDQVSDRLRILFEL